MWILLCGLRYQSDKVGLFAHYHNQLKFWIRVSVALPGDGAEGGAAGGVCLVSGLCRLLRLSKKSKV